jgi:tripartite-type tricarboxylate transporter receptor subunit TctC
MPLFALACGDGAAQSGPAGSPAGFPSRPVRLIIPFTAAGGNDVVARSVAQKLTEAWGQQVVGDNRVGANGIIGIELAAKAPPDGHTLVIVSTSFTISPSTQKVPFDPVRDFAPVGLVASGSLLVTVHAGYPAAGFQELLAIARAKPGTVQFASAGFGGITHLAGELLQRRAGISLVHVPYKGSSAGVLDVISGQVPMMISSVGPAMPHIRTGKLRALAIGDKARSKLLPEVPIIAEAGVPGFESAIWWGFLAPAGTPVGLIDRLNRDVDRALRDDALNQRFNALGMEAVRSTPAELTRLIRSDLDRWGTITREIGIRER